MPKIWPKIIYVLAVLFVTTVAVIITATYLDLTVNNRFVVYAVIFCTDIALLTLLFVKTTPLLRNMVLGIIGMSAFAFILVPMYNVFCEVTGLNGKLDLSIAAANEKGIDKSRDLTVEFVVSQNRDMPWEFKPKHHNIVLHPGQLVTTAYYAHNPTSSTMYAQAIPSITPARARKYFKKVECFCFSKQKLGPGETAHFGLRFYLDPEIPKDIQRVTLAYTIFDITQQER